MNLSRILQQSPGVADCALEFSEARALDAIALGTNTIQVTPEHLLALVRSTKVLAAITKAKKLEGF